MCPHQQIEEGFATFMRLHHPNALPHSMQWHEARAAFLFGMNAGFAEARELKDKEKVFAFIRAAGDLFNALENQPARK